MNRLHQFFKRLVNYLKFILILNLKFSKEEYYKISVFLPCLDCFILHFKNRFEQNNDI